jgi:S-phase kinase-associated protein 1
MSHIKLQSSDNQVFALELAAAKQSTTLRTMLEDLGIGDEVDTEVIPLPNVRSEILRLIVDWSVRHKDDPILTDDDDLKFYNTNFEDLPEWDRNLVSGLNTSVLFELTLAANYLDIAGLLNLACKGIANLMNGKSPEELRKCFNVQV